MTKTMEAEGKTYKVGDPMTFCSQKKCRDGSINLTQKHGTIKNFRTVKQALVETRKGHGSWIDMEVIDG